MALRSPVRMASSICAFCWRASSIAILVNGLVDAGSRSEDFDCVATGSGDWGGGASTTGAACSGNCGSGGEVGSLGTGSVGFASGVTGAAGSAEGGDSGGLVVCAAGSDATGAAGAWSTGAVGSAWVEHGSLHVGS